MATIGRSAWLALMNWKPPTAGPDLPREPSRRERADVTLQFQLPVLTPQPDKLVALGRRQAVDGRRRLGLAAALAAVSLRDPFLMVWRDGSNSRAEIGWIAAGTDPIDHLPPELSRVCRAGLGHRENTSRESGLGAQQTSAIPSGAQRQRRLFGSCFYVKDRLTPPSVYASDGPATSASCSKPSRLRAGVEGEATRLASAQSRGPGSARTTGSASNERANAHHGTLSPRKACRFGPGRPPTLQRGREARGTWPKAGVSGSRGGLSE
ncbi:hypothetical protein LPLAFNJD_LOCUS905 [Methylorubrum aminovorans]